ncbi:MAG: hypothetical protein NZ873_00750 [Crenarchaeota archaeon]|nr:hypothetical protein [Thermoproteota archaeon]MDW8033809.1 hypothetical protein [Nitrososphaerota archaeon]
MTYFTVRDVVAIALFAALWGILNATLAPVIFSMFGIPVFCDMIGFMSLILAVWWVRKLGTASAVGFVATVINFVFRPGATHFLGFTAASVAFDILVWLFRYNNCFKKGLIGALFLLAASAISAALAGFIIGMFFMAAPQLAKWGGVIGWVMLHAAGGAAGWLLGIALTISLESRKLREAGTKA